MQGTGLARSDLLARTSLARPSLARPGHPAQSRILRLPLYEHITSYYWFPNLPSQRVELHPPLPRRRL